MIMFSESSHERERLFMCLFDEEVSLWGSVEVSCVVLSPSGQATVREPVRGKRGRVESTMEVYC